MPRMKASAIIICCRRIDMTWENLRVAEDNGIYLDAYRFDTLDYFLGMAERIKFEEAA